MSSRWWFGYQILFSITVCELWLKAFTKITIYLKSFIKHASQCFFWHSHSLRPSWNTWLRFFFNPLPLVWISLKILRAQFDIIITSHTFFNILSDKIGLNFVVIWHRMWQSRSRAFCETKKKQSLGCLLSYKAYTKTKKSTSSSSSFLFYAVDLCLKPIIFVDSFFDSLLTFLDKLASKQSMKAFLSLHLKKAKHKMTSSGYYLNAN